MKDFSILRIFEFMVITALIAVGCGLLGATVSGAAQVGKQTDSPIVAKCKADLAKRFKLQAKDIKVIDKQATTWPDAALGMPESGKMYAQVMTPGSRIMLQARNSQYLYTTSAKAFKYGGPVFIWSYSMLYTRPAKGEPNLNNDLYQCSLLGTNTFRLVSGMAAYYPQEKGAVIFTRRTSRSGFDLLYIKAGKAAKEKILRSAFDFGAAAFNSAQDEWAGYVRPRLGGAWCVVVAPLPRNSANARTLDLPEGVRPGQIAWSGENLMILAKKGEGTACFETSPKAGTPEWKAVGTHTFPGLPDFMLNKSQSLEIDQVKDSAKPSVEVALVWFTGDRDVKATVSGLTLRGYDLLGGRYAFIWGEKGSRPAAYTVDIATGEVIPSYSGAGQDIKPFLYPPHGNPIVQARSK